MALDWTRYCRNPEFSVEGTDVEVELADGRAQRVRVAEHDDAIHLSAIVGRRHALDGIDDVALRTWQRNREMQLIGFRLDERGRLVGEVWVPKMGLTREEFIICLKTMALESD